MPDLDPALRLAFCVLRLWAGRGPGLVGGIIRGGAGPETLALQFSGR